VESVDLYNGPNEIDPDIDSECPGKVSSHANIAAEGVPGTRVWVLGVLLGTVEIERDERILPRAILTSMNG